MELGVVGLSLSCLNYTDTLDFIKEIDGNCLELCTVKNAHRESLDLSLENRATVKKMTDERGIRMVSVAGYNDFTVLDRVELNHQVEQLSWYCNLATDLDVKLIRVMSGDPNSRLFLEEHLTSVIAGMKLAIQATAKLKVTLALENHGYFINDADTMLRVLEEVGSERLKITLDTGNFCWAGHSLNDAYRYFERLGPYIANVHLKDFIINNRQVKFVPLGEGILCFKELLSVLQKNGYQGALLCEYEGAGEPKELIKAGIFNRDEYVNHLKEGTKQSLHYIRSILGS